MDLHINESIKQSIDLPVHHIMHDRPCSIANFGLTAQRVDVQLGGDLVVPGYGSNRMCSTAKEHFKDVIQEQQQQHRWWLWNGDVQKYRHDPVLVRAAQHGPLFPSKLLLVGEE
jgi:hypothetical protein